MAPSSTTAAASASSGVGIGAPRAATGCLSLFFFLVCPLGYADIIEGLDSEEDREEDVLGWS